jgi:cytochrome b561
MRQLPDADAQRRYSTVAIVLHWTIAALILTNVLVGFRAAQLTGFTQFYVLQWHKSYGITVLLLSLVRLGWRLANPPPPLPARMASWERIAANATHWGFYVLMIGLPLTGWIMVSASPLNIPTLLYGAIPWPHIGFIHALPLAERKALVPQVLEVHEFLAWTAIALLVLHVGAALKHQVVDRDVVLWRIAPAPGLKPRQSNGEDQ